MLIFLNLLLTVVGWSWEDSRGFLNDINSLGPKSKSSFGPLDCQKKFQELIDHCTRHSTKYALTNRQGRPKRKKPKSHCVGRNGKRYSPGKGYLDTLYPDEPSIRCIQYTCVRVKKGKQMKMMKKNIPCKGIWPPSTFITSTRYHAGPGAVTLKYTIDSSDPNSCQYGVDLNSYSGTVSKTEDGQTCLNWESIIGISSYFIGISSDFEENPAEHHNYCRNPDKDNIGVWCCLDKLCINYGYCDVPYCKETSSSRISLDYETSKIHTGPGDVTLKPTPSGQTTQVHIGPEDGTPSTRTTLKTPTQTQTGLGMVTMKPTPPETMQPTPPGKKRTTTITTTTTSESPFTATTVTTSTTTTTTTTSEDGVNVEFFKVGDGKVHKPKRMGIYIITKKKMRGYPVYEQKKNNNFKKTQFLFVDKFGKWRVGPNIKTWKGTTLRNKNKKPTPPKTGWQYLNRKRRWISDSSIQIREVVQECSTPQHTAVSNNNLTTITSPGYPEKYPDNLNCSWTFTAPLGEKVSFTMLEVETEYGYDVVKIYDLVEHDNKKSPILATMSGNKSQQVVISTKEKMMVTFTSDSNTNMKGFKASIVAFKKTDLPKLEWTDFKNLNILFPNGETETFQLHQMPNTQTACIFEGSNNSATVIITSPFSTSDKCRSLDQSMEISIISKNLQNMKGIYTLKNGQLFQVDINLFTENAVKRKRNLTNMKREKREAVNIPKLIQIPIKFGYDRGLLLKFSKYDHGRVYIKKRIEEIFYHIKWSLQGMLKKINMELLLDENIIFVNEVLEINNKNLLSCRKYQHDEKVPILILVEEDYHNNIKGLTFRSGACRKDNDRYGVALISWRDDGSLAGDVLAHELGHLIGGIHTEGNKTHTHEHETHDHGCETHVGHSDLNYENVKFWFNLYGNRCYGKSCSSPPEMPNGSWRCDDEYQTCNLKCEAGFATAFSTIQCQNGDWSENINDMACYPSVLFMAGGSQTKKDVDIFNATCSNKPPALGLNWYEHTSFFHQGSLYLCGGWATQSKCVSIDSRRNTWKTHTLLAQRAVGHSSVVMRNSVYFIGGMTSGRKHSETAMTTLPLADTSVWTSVPNLSYKGQGQCVVIVDHDNFVITGGYYSAANLDLATKYNVIDGTNETLPSMLQERLYHGCVVVEENGKIWIVVAGGYEYINSTEYHLQSTEILDVSGKGNEWESIGNLSVARPLMGMAVTAKGVIVLGGLDHNIELLDWEIGEWQLIQQSRTNIRNDFRGILEIPAHLFSCQIDTAIECPSLPPKENGSWICDSTDTRCSLTCDPGFASIYTDTKCIHGSWKEVNRMKCEESILFLTGGYGAGQNVEVFNVDTGNVTCSIQPPALDLEWYRHTSFSHQGTLYVCGGVKTYSFCISLNSELNTWKQHDLLVWRIEGLSSVVVRNKLYFIGSGRNHEDLGAVTWTDLPLTVEPHWSSVKNMSYKGIYQCVVKINQDNFVITGGHDTYDNNGTSSRTVLRYNVEDENTEALGQLIHDRYRHGCVVVEKSGKSWIMVTGGVTGWYNGYLKSTEKLDISGSNKEWKRSGNINSIRYGHGMAVIQKGVIVIGGYNTTDYLKSIELLDWDNDVWKVIEPSLTHARSDFGGVIEMPTQTFGCQTQAFALTGCAGEYKYNMTYAYEDEDLTQVSKNETCHSVCKTVSECVGWTWTQEEKCYTIKNNTFIDTLHPKNGSISGLKNSCKPKCYLIVADQDEVSTSTQICDEENTQKGCLNLIHMEPDEFHEEDRDNILVCFEVEKRTLCDKISLDEVDLVCNPEPGIVTLSTYQRINKHFFTRHLGPSFSWWG